MLCSNTGKRWKCEKETDLGFRSCYLCRLSARKAKRKQRAARTGKGLCGVCTIRFHRPGKKRCTYCAEYAKTRDLIYRSTHRETYNEYHKGWRQNLRAGWPTTEARRAEVDRG